MAAQSRLRTVIDDGLLSLPAGRVHVMRPPADYDLSPLDDHELTLDHVFFPAVSAFRDAGYDVVDDIGSPAATIVVLPRDKALARDMIARAAAASPLVVVDGYKTDGVDSVFKAARKALGDVPSVPKDHGRIFWMEPGDVFADWAAPAASTAAHGFVTTVGIFSADKIDAGSALLADALPAKLPARMADLGAGWGYLAGPILSRDGVRSLTLVEADRVALNCAQANVDDPRVQFLWADATDHRPEQAYDGIVMNPPFHQGRAADPGLGRSFIASAAKMLAPHGKIWIVANRHLPYEATLRDHFRNVDELPGNGAFKIFHASRPNR